MHGALPAHPPPLPSEIRRVLSKVYSLGKWVVQWDHLIVVPQQRLAYFVLGASHGRVFVVSMHRMPAGLLSFEALYQLPMDWHGAEGESFNAVHGQKLLGDRKRVVDELEARARSYPFHLVGDFGDATAERTLESPHHPPEGHYWRWRTGAATRAEPLGRALHCAFQHPRVTRAAKRAGCLHCEYPFDGTGRRPPKRHFD